MCIRIRILHGEGNKIQAAKRRNGKGHLIRLRTIGGFFEGIGVLLYRKLVDIRLVDDLFRESIKVMWEKAKAPLCDARQRFNIPSYGRYFEYLYNELQNREQSLQQIQQ